MANVEHPVLPQIPLYRSRSGFTFLEIVIVLMIIAIIFVGTLPVVVQSLEERELREYADDLAEFVQRERRGAETDGRERRLIFAKEGLTRVDSEGEKEVAFEKPEAYEMQVRFPGEKWSKPDGQQWRFFAAGMVTPLTVRFEQDKRWMELDFDFLTGRVAEQRFAFE